MAGAVDSLIAAGNDAVRRGDGVAARRAFEEAAGLGEAGAIYEGLARARYLELDYPGSIAAHERAYAAYRAEGDDLAAARVARMLAWLHANLYGDWAVCNGWFARAQSFLAASEGDGPERGWALALSAWLEPDAPDCDDRLALARDIGRRFGDADLEFEAVGWTGVRAVLAGRVEEGMRLVDEALAAVCGGEVSDLYVTEGAFCGMFMVCEWTHDISRADQWLRAADDLVRRRNLVAVGAHCRAHYGGILTEAGRWAEAEAELTEAARIFEQGYRDKHSVVLTRLAELRVRQGRLEEAAHLLDGLDQHPDAVRPLAALRLARGEVALAADGLERALAQPGAPWAVTAPLLSILVDVHLAAGYADAAAHAAAQLADLAAEHPNLYLRASAALASGKICLAQGAGDARSCLEDALSAFSRARMPVELARARLELARAVATDRPEVAVAEANAAYRAFEQLGARRDADAAAALLRTLGAAGRSGPRGRDTLTRREAEVLALLADGLSNTEIGDRLYISAKTVEHHVGRVLMKLGLRNRAEAAAYAIRNPPGESGPR